MRDTWPLMGRDEEAGVIAELLAAGDYGGVALAGRAGVGKSRLAQEAVAAAAESGWSVRHVVATATGRSVPLCAFAHWVDDPDGAPLTLTRGVIRALTAQPDPGRVLVFVDDAHLLDELSALVVHQLVLERAAVVILTIRSGHPAPEPVTSLWKDGRLRRIELQPLSRDESDDLLCAVVGRPPDEDCAERLWRLTRGNALFLRQLVEQEVSAGRLVCDDGWCRWRGDPEVTPSLVEVVEHQIGAIPAEVRDVVDIVAVAEPIDRNCLAALADPMAVEEAEQRELITTTGDAVCVGHPMYAEVRLNQCGPLRLRRLRGAVARAMKDNAGAANVVRRGLLWLESDLAPDPDVLAAAAAAAGSLRDFDLAARLSRAAAESGVGTEARVDLAYNLVLSQQGDEAASVIDSIAAEEVAEEAFINDVILRAANLLWAMRSPEDSWRVIDEALEDATGPRRGQLLAFRANQLMLAARPADVVDMMSTADYGTLDGYGQAVRLCSEIFALAEVGRTDDALIRAEACHAVIASCEQGSFLSQALVEFHAFALTVAGRNREALALVQRHQDDCGADPDNAKAMAAAIVGAAALSTGDLPTAVQELPNEDAAGDPHLVLVNSFYRFQLLRAQALARLGDVDAARTAIRIAEADWHPTYVLAELNTLIAKAWLAAVEQRLSDARELVRQATIFTREHGQLAREVVCLQTAVQFGDTTVAERLSELAGFVDGARAPLAARYARALDVDDANELDAVSADFEEMGDVLAAADAAGHASAAHRRAGRRGPAMTAGSRAEALASACGGATSPAIVMARFTVPFTRREHEIALLVARGLSNKEIAESVSLSVRTIEGHIYRASCKVGVTSRSDLAVAVRNLRDRTLAAAR